LGSLNSAECCEAKSEMESVKPGRLQKSSIFSSRPRGAWVEAACVYWASEPDGGATAIDLDVRRAREPFGKVVALSRGELVGN
jgi:hypothetical protein